MRREVYQEYLRVIKEALEIGQVNNIHSELLDHNDSTDIVVTIKNYQRKGGLSQTFFSREKSEYEV
jgi:hypothetical protein